MTFCQIIEVASRVRQKVVDHRSLTIEKCSVQEIKVVRHNRSVMAGSLMTGSTVLEIHKHIKLLYSSKLRHSYWLAMAKVSADVRAGIYPGSKC